MSLPIRRHAHPLLAAVFVLCGLGWAWANGVDASRVFASRHWPTVPGQVTGSELVMIPAGWTGGRAGSHRLYREEFHVRYAYTVAGRAYEGSRLDLNTPPAWFYPRHALERFRSGAPVTVHYDADDPAESVLLSDVPLRLVMQTLLGLAAAVVGVVFFQTRPDRQRQRQQ